MTDTIKADSLVAFSSSIEPLNTDTSMPVALRTILVVWTLLYQRFRDGILHYLNQAAREWLTSANAHLNKCSKA